ncbi:phage holin family protein [Alteribacter natronophilus]|uniref:phage holin family protein n=1 Tax=Alteribacter natronophilus TaxID=2583810 RepID=UPI00110D5597|nr:phage holin family protein [Alteribacter natronophilus]TMW72406.1 phage holin family protein [Alteribacter natronophilus]
MGWLIQIVVNAVVLMIIARLFSGIEIDGVMAALLASFILAIVNLIVKPILIVLTLPVTILTLGLFLFVINAIALMITQFFMGGAFTIDGFGLAIIAAIIFAILSALIHTFIVDPITKR